MAAFMRCSEHGAGRSMDGLEQDAPATGKRCPARCVTLPAGRRRTPLKNRALRGLIAYPERTFGTKVPAYEEAASSISAF